jgi:hypothetical protein
MGAIVVRVQVNALMRASEMLVVVKRAEVRARQAAGKPR